MDEHQVDLDAQLEQRFLQLPRVVQDAITSADIESHLRELAPKHNLHLDQWELLENEVMLALLGIQKTEDLATNLEKHVNVPHETAISLAAEISHLVFEPVRRELERGLEHPAAQAEQASAVDTVRTDILGTDPGKTAAQQSTPENDTKAKAIRGSIDPSYTSKPSHERKTIEGDPYREQII